MSSDTQRHGIWREGTRWAVSPVWIAFLVAALALAGAAWLAAGIMARGDALAALSAQARTDASLKVAHLRAVLERPRALPFLLSEDGQVAAALQSSSPADHEALSAKLATIVAGTDAAVIYVVGRNGVAIASSNWKDPTSFVGNDYSFRDYFIRGMAAGKAEHFAFGSVSKRPGLYISQRVEGANGPLGIVVAKMEFDQIEADWQAARRPTYVADENGVVLITSLPSWRFMATRALANADLAAIRNSLQFGDAPLTPLPLSVTERVGPGVDRLRGVLPGGRETEFLRITAPVPSTGWQLNSLVATRGAVAALVREQRLLALAGVAPVVALAALLLARRQSVARRLGRELAAREELEARVAARTDELRRARDRLESEIADHRTTEAKLQGVQDDLVHANRLAILGQVAAGVAHEINQPLATIRAYADNARIFMDREQRPAVEDNLEEIAALTERIGRITDELKGFARKGRAPADAVSVAETIDSVVMLLKSRFSGPLNRLTLTALDPALQVTANRLRLEQVMINLVQNALEAVAPRADGAVRVAAAAAGEAVRITVADNGPGIAPEILAQLFTPFNTSKERGLGLGLVIAKDILADYGGTLGVETGPAGTIFTITLPKAAGEETLQ
ncbi:sensor histidine kinase [Rhizobium sp. CC-YZS058]|uniref:sensor histidine kinase n=1 Tax=Rhizobium sp. CC-YZS058 TaxID=3042153 RepID=UPI002B0549BC|nr:ATP-binding protein [Rhizobium sp. CC-YZS058]MEA3534393.1 ATP-binding protein [Rhizobium sp. CC-YZS058]